MKSKASSKVCELKRKKAGQKTQRYEPLSYRAVFTGLPRTCLVISPLILK